MKTLQATFAILDVKRGRIELNRRLAKGERIKVMIEGEISEAWGGYDGVSQAFSVDVTGVKVGGKQD